MLSVSNKNTTVYISKDYVTNNKLKCLKDVYKIIVLKEFLACIKYLLIIALLSTLSIQEKEKKS